MIDIGLSTVEWSKSNKIPTWFEAVTTSTNDVAKEQGFKNESSWIFVTNEQTKGRGRNTNSWLNSENEGSSLLISWCFKLKSAPQPISSPLFGWAVFKSLNDEFDLNLSIKAPNDIYANSKKLGGILLESVTQGSKHFICVGIGLNILSKPKNFSEAGSLKEEIGVDINKDRWFRFLSSLNTNLTEATVMCQNSEIPSVVQNEILLALKKWPENNVAKILSNGDLIIDDGSGESFEVPWTDL